MKLGGGRINLTEIVLTVGGYFYSEPYKFKEVLFYDCGYKLGEYNSRL